MLRFKLEDLPPRLREQAERQLSPLSVGATSSPRQSTAGSTFDRSGKDAAPTRRKRVRPPITMKRKNEQSSAERRFNAEFLAGRGKFEALTLHLPGGSRYTPDFLCLMGDCQVQTNNQQPNNQQPLILVEVKGSYRLQSHARAATAFKTACACFPEFAFCWAELQKDGKSWKVTFFRDGQQLGDTQIVSNSQPL